MGVSSFLRLQPGLKLLKPFSGAAHVLITPNGDPIFAHRDAAPATINQCAYCIAEPPSRSSFLPLQPGLDQTADGFGNGRCRSRTLTVSQLSRQAKENPVRGAGFERGKFSGAHRNPTT